MKIAVVVGHNARAQGAVRVTDNVTEFQWNSDLARMIEELDPSSVEVFKRRHGGGYAAEIDRVYGEVNEWGADCSVELHFNGSGNAGVHGCETLTSGTRGSRRLAQYTQAKMLKALTAKDRGCKIKSRHDRGGRSLWAGRAPAILIEPYFGSHAASCATATVRKQLLAEAIYEGAKAFCKSE